MAKKVAVISYNLNPSSSLTTDAVVFRDTLNAAGFAAKLVHQWSLDETNAATFKPAAYWQTFAGIVICNFYGTWNLREVILSKRPVICANSGYADDLGLGERPVDHISEDDFNVTNNTKPTTLGLPLGSLDVGSPVWVDSISTFNHKVDVLITTLASNPVLATHPKTKHVYFGWYRMSQASPGSPLFTLLTRAAKWAF